MCADTVTFCGRCTESICNAVENSAVNAGARRRSVEPTRRAAFGVEFLGDILTANMRREGHLGFFWPVRSSQSMTVRIIRR